MSSLEISTDQFKLLAERITQLAARYLDGLDARPIAPDITGQESVRLFEAPLPEHGLASEALDSLETVINSGRAQNARFFGYVLGSGEPVAAVADLLASVLNQNVTAWRSGPAAVMMEHTVVRWLAEAVGCSGFRGYLTGGASSANLMGLTMARESIAPANESGANIPVAVYASEEIHMSIPKSVALLGIGRRNLRLIPTDSAFRMDLQALESQIRADKSAGIVPMAIVASAGTVKTGAIDPLRQIGEIARAHQAWFHIDGAYGALAAIAKPERFDGINTSDSISLDPHKWLYQPLDCGCLLYRDPRAGQKAFSHTGDYARTLSEDPIEGFAFFEESLELSRRFRALKLWLSLRYHGLAAFRESIAKDLRQARRLAAAIRTEPRLELVASGDLSAVCFRYKAESGATEGGLDRLNAELLRQLIKRGRVYLSNASINGKFCLRACIVNHRTKDSDIDEVVREVLLVGNALQTPSVSSS